jgi:hypothetical protein
MNFKFFRGNELDLPNRGRYGFIINHPQLQRHRIVFISTIPRDQLPDHILDQICQDNVATIRNQINYNGDVESWIENNDDNDGFTIFFDIYY